MSETIDSNKNLPTAEELEGLFKDLQGTMSSDYALDIRLQLLDDSWNIWTGDAQYDTDHRGDWGAGYLERDTNCLELANELIEEALDSRAQRV